MRLLWIVSVLASLASAQYKLSTNCIDVLSNSSDYRSFIYALQRTRLIPFINKMANCTLFAPVNSAFHNVPPNQITRTRLLYHVMDTVRTTNSIQTADVLESALILGRRMGKHRGQRIKAHNSTTIGNVRILHADQMASNGVVHGVDGLLELPSNMHTLLHSVQELEGLRRLLDQAGMLDELKQERPFTIFAPSDQVLSNELSPYEHKYLMHTRGAQDLALFTGHFMVTQDPVFGAEIALGGNVSATTLAGQSISIIRDTNHTLTVDGVQVASQDWIASNGVLHVLRHLMQPKKLQFTPFKLMHSIEGTRFADLLRDTGLDALVNDTTRAFSIFVPSNDAIPSKVKDTPMNDRCKYHMIAGNIPVRHGIVRTLLSDEVTGNASLPVFTEVVDGRIVRVNGVPLRGPPVIVGNSTLYPVDGFLPTPPALLDHLPRQAFSSIFTRAVYLAQQDGIFKTPHGATYFIPTDTAFRWLGLMTDYMLLGTGNAFKQLQHMVRGTLSTTKTVFTDEVPQHEPLRMETVDGDVLLLYARQDGYWLESPTTHVAARIVTPDTPVRNGAIHYIDRVILPPRVHITVTNLLQGAGGNTFLDAIKRVGLSGLLDRSLNDLNAQGLTLLVPPDDAFVGFNDTILYSDLTSLRRFILSHVIRSTVNATGTYSTLLANRKINVQWTDYVDELPQVDVEMDGVTVHVNRMGRVGYVQVFKVSGLLLERQGWGWGWWLLVATSSVASVTALGTFGYKKLKARRRRRLVADVERDEENLRLLNDHE